jgi:crotonyl-CoA carboxylase/reductase
MLHCSNSCATVISKLSEEKHMAQPASANDVAAPANTNAPRKDLYEIGEIPPLGHVPKNMYAWAIRRERHGEPETAMQVEVVPTWEIDSDEVLVLVMAAGVNYNGVWASLGIPISPFDGHKSDFHVAGSDASGIVWAVGRKVKRWKVGDEVVIHCNQDDGDDEECNGGDPMFSTSQRIWGYETPDGSFAQFCRVQARQLMPRPKASDLGRSGLLHAHTGNRLPYAVRPPPAHSEAWPERAGLGRLRRAGLDGRPAHCDSWRQRHRGHLRGRQDDFVLSSVPRVSSTARTSTAGARCRRSAPMNTTPG